MSTTPSNYPLEDRCLPKADGTMPFGAAVAGSPLDPRSLVDELAADFTLLVDKAMNAVRSAAEREDAVFGVFNQLRSTLQSIAYHEGRLLEWGLLRIARCNPDLVVLPQNRPMPIVKAALDILERNAWEKLDGIVLNAQVHAIATYTPDLLIVDRPSQSALIVDVKRSVASTEGRRLDALLKRMMAAGLTAASWIYCEHRGMLISDVRIAIIDGSNDADGAVGGVFPLSALDGLLRIDGAGAAMDRLRAMFARRVQQELEVLCRDLVTHLGDQAAASERLLAARATFSNANDGERCGERSDNAATDGADQILASDPDLPPPEIAVVRVGLARTAIH